MKKIGRDYVLESIAMTHPYGLGEIERVYDMVGSYDSTIKWIEWCCSMALNPYDYLSNLVKITDSRETINIIDKLTSNVKVK